MAGLEYTFLLIFTETMMPNPYHNWHIRIQKKKYLELSTIKETMYFASRQT
jgi:hypothetical protein